MPRDGAGLGIVRLSPTDLAWLRDGWAIWVGIWLVVGSSRDPCGEAVGGRLNWCGVGKVRLCGSIWWGGFGVGMTVGEELGVW